VSGELLGVGCVLGIAYIVGVGHGVRLGWTWWNRMSKWAETAALQQEETP
jgi:hypothetical protein